jgi:type II secretory pathway pseudopilin PulG
MHSMRIHRTIRRRRKGEQGYILLILLLAVTVMMIAAAVAISDIKFQMKRDREEEMVRRGVQYSRAIRAYYKKFQRYPSKIEDLESTNRLRFLRKRYKDPLNCAKGKCEDFKLLHYGDVQMALGAGLGIPAANMTGPNGAVGLGPGGVQSQGENVAVTNPDGSSENFQQTSTVGTVGDAPGQPTGQNPTNGLTNGSTSGPFGSTSSGNLTGQTFGGGGIIGVASNFKCPPHKKEECDGIREYNKKKKFTEWQFVYDPSLDRGFLITTPYQPSLAMGMGAAPNLNGQLNGQGANGNSSGFGNNNSGFGNNNGGFGNNNSGFGNSNSGFGNNNSGFGNNNSGSGNNSFGNSSGGSQNNQNSGSGNQNQ